MAWAFDWTSIKVLPFLNFLALLTVPTAHGIIFWMAKIECLIGSCVVDSTTRKCGKAGSASSSSDMVGVSVAFLFFVLSLGAFVVLTVAMVLYDKFTLLVSHRHRPVKQGETRGTG
jgi:hypothetical protein